MAERWIEEYVSKQVDAIREAVGEDDCAVAAVSGGVDSTTAALLAYKALGPRLHPIFIDTGFMRRDEPRMVAEALRGVLPIEIVDYSEEFVEGLLGLSDAEEKRRVFRDLFYRAVSREASRLGCSYIVQGTIAPDIIETVGGIKTQHNVLEQAGLDPLRRYGFRIIEPLKELYKDEVREAASMLGLPRWIAGRQPFPGPGLLVRVVGTVTREKLEVVREATSIVEEWLEGRGASQYFAAVWEDDVYASSQGLWIYRGVRATGVRGDARRYGPVALYRGEWRRPGDLAGHVARLPSLPEDPVRLVAELAAREAGRYTVAVRAVVTEDFMTADILDIDAGEARRLAEDILAGIDAARRVVYDVTPKPPATIEYE